MQKIFLKAYKKIYKIFSGRGIGMIFPIRQINEFVVSKLRKDFAVVDGQKMFLDQKDSLCLSTYGIFDKLETELIKKEIKEGDIALDIGANIGYYTLLLARQVGKKGKVFAFEPDPKNFALLKKNVEANGYKNVILEQKAVSDKNRKKKLFLSEANSTTHNLYNLHDSKKAIEVETVSLDEYFKKNKKIDFIKMDIEGAEWDALHGMKAVLKKNKRIKMIVEFAPKYLKKAGVNASSYLNLLLDYGFKLYHIDFEKKEIKPASCTELLEKYSLERIKKHPFPPGTNLFCKRQKKTKCELFCGEF